MATKRDPKSPPHRMLNVRVPADRIPRLRAVAQAEHRTVSQELRRMIDERLAEAEADEKAAA